MDENERSPEIAAIDGHESSSGSVLGVQQNIQANSTAVIITGLDGVIQRVIQSGNLLPEGAEHVLPGETIDFPFVSTERAFLLSLLGKARAAQNVVAGSFPVQLRGADDPPVYLSFSEIADTHPGDRLLAWNLSPDGRAHAQLRGENEAALNRRIDTLDARRRAAERSQRALAAARDTNRSLARSLKSARELSDNQAAIFKESNNTKDEIVQRVRESWASEVDARQNAEQAYRHLGFLNQANYTLNQSLDFNTTLKNIASIVVPRVSDCCIVHLLDEDRGILRRAVVVSQDPSIADSLNHQPVEHDRDNDADQLYRAMYTGSAIVVRDQDQATGTGDLFTQFREAGIRSSVITTLRSRDRVLGTMTFASTDPARTYLPGDLLMAEALAFSAGQAVDNALLYQRAEEASKVRDRYLSMASHELRSPLTVVSGFAALILRQLAAEDLDVERIRMLGHELQRGVDRLEMLTDGLLASASLQGSLPESSFVQLDLSALVQDLLTSMNATPELIGDHSVTFDAPESLRGYWDPESLERALFNIVSNALKYSPDQRNVHVSVSTDGDTAAISVRDEGIGMSEDEQAELFSPFVRGRVARETAQGTGLGLYITRQIVEQHRGTIDVESQPGEGSTFTIRLPLNLLEKRELNASA